MAFCARCGTELPAGAAFCPKCGAPSLQGAPPAGYVSRTGFDTIYYDTQARTHWFSRLIAFFIDGVIVGGISFVLAMTLWFPFFFMSAMSGATFPFYDWGGFMQFLGVQLPIVSGLLSLLYFTVAESQYGRSFGKMLMGLRVESTSGTPLRVDQALIRNVSKVYWLLLLLDVVAGLATQGDYRQKYSDRFARSTVV